MISLSFNGEEITVEKSTLAELLECMKVSNQGYAVMINRSFIPSAEYQKRVLEENDIIELIAPMQGG